MGEEGARKGPKVQMEHLTPVMKHGVDTFMESMMAAFPVEKDPNDPYRFRFPDLNLTVVKARGITADLDIFKGRSDMLATAAVFLSEDSTSGIEDYERQVVMACSYGLSPVVVVAGGHGFKRDVDRRLGATQLLHFEHAEAVAKLSPGGRKWWTYAPKDRKALMILQACRAAAQEWGPEPEDISPPPLTEGKMLWYVSAAGGQV